MQSLADELKEKIIATLTLEDVTPGDIKEEAPLIGEGLGLDSVDVLELVVMLERDYGIIIQEREVAVNAFASLRSLESFILQHRKACSDATQS
jgi:acyl carrier protein